MEAIISGQSRMVGRTIRESGIRRHYGVVVAAVHRKGVKLSESYQDIKLAFETRCCWRGRFTTWSACGMRRIS